MSTVGKFYVVQWTALHMAILDPDTNAGGVGFPGRGNHRLPNRVVEVVRETRGELERRLAEDLDGSFEQLVLAYQDRLYAFALSLTGRPEDAEEVAQDAFVRAYRALRGYPPERVREMELKAWLHRVALNVFRNRVRGRRPALVALNGEVVDFERPGPDESLVNDESRREMAELVAGLPARYRSAVVLRHVQGFSYAEIAGILGRPVGTVKSDVHRGVEELRRRSNDGERS